MSLEKIYNRCHNAIGQILAIPNGVQDYENVGTCWLFKNNNNIYVITASHIVDNEDAYLDNISVQYSSSGNSIRYSNLFPNLSGWVLAEKMNLTNQNKILFANISSIYGTNTDTFTIRNIVIENSQHQVIWDHTSRNYLTLPNLNDTTYSNDPNNDILSMIYAPKPDIMIQIPFTIDFDQATSEYVFTSSVNPINQMAIMSIDLSQLDDPKFLSCIVQYNTSSSTDRIFIMTAVNESEDRLSRWIVNTFYDKEFISYNGLVLCTFSDLDASNLIDGHTAKGSKYTLPLCVIGGDHRSDTAILAPIFDENKLKLSFGNVWFENITQKSWENQSSIQLGQMNIGEFIGSIGNPYFLLKTSIMGGNVRDNKYSSISTIPTECLMTDMDSLSGMSGSPFLGQNSKCGGMYTFGIGQNSISGGPNYFILSVVLAYVCDKFEKHKFNVFKQIEYKKGFLGIDYVDVDATDLFIGTTMPHNSLYDNIGVPQDTNGTFTQTTGIKVISMDLTSPLVGIVNVGDILIRARYKDRNTGSEKIVRFGTREFENGIYPIVYGTHPSDTIYLTFYKINPLDSLTNRFEHNLAISMGRYPVHSDYYFGETNTQNDTPFVVVNRSKELRETNDNDRNHRKMVGKFLINIAINQKINLMNITKKNFLSSI